MSDSRRVLIDGTISNVIPLRTTQRSLRTSYVVIFRGQFEKCSLYTVVKVVRLIVHAPESVIIGCLAGWVRPRHGRWTN